MKFPTPDPRRSDPAAGHDDSRVRLWRRCGHPGRHAHIRVARRARLRGRDRRDRAELDGRQGFSRDPARRHRRPDRSRGRATSASRPPRPACWRRRPSSRRLPTPGVSKVWRMSCRSSSIPVCASMHGDPLLHPSALDSLRTQLFPLATLVTPNLDEVRLLVDIDVVDDATQREAARALHALGPQWALVKGGHLRSSPDSPDLLYDGTDFYEFGARAHRHRRRSRRGRHAGRRDRQRAGPRLHRARRGGVRQVSG